MRISVMHKCFTSAYKQSSSASALVFRELTNVQEHYVEIPYTKFCTNHTINVEGMDVNSFTHLREVCLSL